MMSSVVSKSSSVIRVRPLIPLTMMSDTTIKLSPLDKENFPMAVLLIYEHPINNAANTIKTALSQALVHYYPFSGRFVPGADGTGAYIDCSGEGAAEFIVAVSADCSLKQVATHIERSPSGDGGTCISSSLLDQLVGHYTTIGYGTADPLLSVQLTEFTCGGFIISVTWSHAIADGAGIAQFLGSVGELARGLSSPSIFPIRWDEAVSSLPSPPNPVGDVIMPSLAAHGYSFTKMIEDFPLAVLDVTIPWSFISRIKSEFDGQPCCTTFEVATAVLWRCRTRATMLSHIDDDDDTLCALAFPVNVRKHVGAKDGYYGNCVVDKLVKSTTVAVADRMHIMDLVKMIRQAKDQVTDDLRLDGKKKENASSSSSKNQVPGVYNTLLVSSWRNIGFEAADFGSGPPARVVWPVRMTPPVPTCIMCPSRAEDGVGAVSVCVKEEHADAFLKEIAKFTSD